MGQVKGIYREYGIYDRFDFVNKMREGLSYEEFVEIDKKAGIRFNMGPGRSAKNKYVPYEFEVDGKKYYGTTKVAYSIDIRAGMAGKPCNVTYDDADPYKSVLGTAEQVQKGNKAAKIWMIVGFSLLGMMVLCCGGMTLISVVMNVINKFL